MSEHGHADKSSGVEQLKKPGSFKAPRVTSDAAAVTEEGAFGQLDGRVKADLWAAGSPGGATADESGGLAD